MPAAQLPPGAFLKDLSAWFNQDTIPRELRAAHSLPPGHWARVIVSEGEVNLFLDGAKAPTVVTTREPVIIAPETPIRLESAGKSGRFCLHYFHEPVLIDPNELAGELGGRAR